MPWRDSQSAAGELIRFTLDLLLGNFVRRGRRFSDGVCANALSIRRAQVGANRHASKFIKNAPANWVVSCAVPLTSSVGVALILAQTVQGTLFALIQFRAVGKPRLPFMRLGIVSGVRLRAIPCAVQISDSCYTFSLACWGGTWKLAIYLVGIE